MNDRHERLTAAIIDQMGGRYFGEGRKDVAEQWATLALAHEDRACPTTLLKSWFIARDYMPANAEKISVELMAMLRGIK